MTIPSLLTYWLSDELPINLPESLESRETAPSASRDRDQHSEVLYGLQDEIVPMCLHTRPQLALAESLRQCLVGNLISINRFAGLTSVFALGQFFN